MASGAVHTVPHGGGWANRIAGADGVSNTAPTKEEARATGRQMAIAAGVEHLVHNEDGTIAERNSYGSDPRESKG